MNKKNELNNDGIEINSIYFSSEECLELTVLTNLGQKFQAGDELTASYTVSTLKTTPIINITSHYTLSILSWVAARTDDNRQSAVIKCKILDRSVEDDRPTQLH